MGGTTTDRLDAFICTTCIRPPPTHTHTRATNRNHDNPLNNTRTRHHMPRVTCCAPNAALQQETRNQACLQSNRQRSGGALPQHGSTESTQHPGNRSRRCNYHRWRTMTCRRADFRGIGDARNRFTLGTSLSTRSVGMGRNSSGKPSTHTKEGKRNMAPSFAPAVTSTLGSWRLGQAAAQDGRMRNSTHKRHARKLDTSKSKEHVAVRWQRGDAGRNIRNEGGPMVHFEL